MEPGAQLLLEDESGELRVIIASGTTSLGSAEGSTIVLRGNGIARHHCVIQSDGVQHELFDLMSESGTLVNGARIEAHLLQHGDSIRIGSAKLVFLHAEQRAAPAQSQHADFQRAFGATLTRAPFQAASVLLHVLLIAALSQVASNAQAEARLPESISLTLEPFSRSQAPAPTPPAPEPEAQQPSLSELLDATRQKPTEQNAAPVPEPPVLQGSLSELAAQAGAAPVAAEAGIPHHDSVADLGLGLGAQALPQGGGGGAGADVALRAGGSAFRQRVYDLQSTGLDIAVIIDSTSSMTSVLDAARAAVGRIVASVATLVPRFRLAIVTYRDAKDEYVTRQLNFSASPWAAVQFLENIQADGGGDTPEAVLEALKVALQRLNWNPDARRVVLLVGDAPPHTEDLEAIRKLVSAHAARASVHTVVTPQGGLGGRHAANPVTISTFADIARTGKGVSRLMADAATLVPTILSGAFGPDQEDALKKAIAALDTSLAVRGARRLVERRDLHALLAALMQETPSVHVLRVLMEQSVAECTPVFLRLLEDPKAPAASRHAAAVLLQRVLRERRASPAVLAVVIALDVRASAAKLATQLQQLRRLLSREGAGLPLDMPPPR